MELSVIGEFDSLRRTARLNVHEKEPSVLLNLARESSLASVYTSLRIR